MVVYYSDEQQLLIWAIPKKGDPAFARVPLGRQALEDKVALLRVAMEPQGGAANDIPPFDLKAAFELYQQILEPVKPGWAGAQNILIVPHGALGYLPFGLLPTAPTSPADDSGAKFSSYRAVPWLVRQAAVTVLPSVSTLTLLRSLPATRGDRAPFAGFGDPIFKPGDAGPPDNPPGRVRGLERRGLPTDIAGGLRGLANLPRLPDTADEVRGIAVTLKADSSRSVFLGAAANKAQVQRMDLSNVRVIEFATHGLQPGEIDGLTQPALALSAPQVTGGTDDGLLTLGDILALKLNADWVVLSACNTGAGAGAGAEALSGLGRAFFYAGSRALLVSNWSVYSEAAKVITTDLFRRQAADRSLGRAEALRQSMLSLIDRDGPPDAKTGKPAYSFAHPVFWAPFSLIGDGGA
jgi:CHAT domain-containing protein